MILLSILYLFIVLCILDAGNLLFEYVINNIEYLTNWFSSIYWIFKWIIVIFILPIFIKTMMVLLGELSLFIESKIFNKLPNNTFTQLTSLLFILNAGYNIFSIWTIPSKYGFWIIIELIYLSIIAICLSAVASPRFYKGQKKEYLDKKSR